METAIYLAVLEVPHPLAEEELPGSLQQFIVQHQGVWGGRAMSTTRLYNSRQLLLFSVDGYGGSASELYEEMLELLASEEAAPLNIEIHGLQSWDGSDVGHALRVGNCTVYMLDEVAYDTEGNEISRRRPTKEDYAHGKVPVRHGQAPWVVYG
uniref:Uncharacterized protein n=1 Tax=Magnetococcus massalia (strain MO-1) TaxID=451514 RepID=A0A1S7LEX1_MAGMO|nr:protein of unknown function [Candidatus Magnetococcus massalia]